MIFKGEGEFLEINVSGRLYPNENWLGAEIRIDVPGFTAQYGTCLRSDDLQWFYEAIVQLKNNVSTRAEFTTMEGGLYLNCELQRTGRVDCTGKADNNTGNVLEFYMSLENQAICNLLLQLERLLKDYPVMGHP